MNPNRVQPLNNKGISAGPIVYWMSRDQRAQDNWALLKAQELALDAKQPLLVVFCMAQKFLEATYRQYDFMIQGLKETEQELAKHHIPFIVLAGPADTTLPDFIKKHKVGAVVTDFNPLKIKMGWDHKIAKLIEVSLLRVDAHNIVPAWVASPKQEFAAYTFRPKVHKKLNEYLEEFPKLKNHPHIFKSNFKNDWNKLIKSLEINFEIKPVDWIKPGATEAKKTLNHFIKSKLSKYDELRNDPTDDAQSNISPYLHFGQIAPQRVALEIDKLPHSKNQEAYLEELIVRRELSDNFCYYNKNYDTPEAFPDWAKKTIAEHKNDPREQLYTLKELEHAKTYDELWNASQMEMVNTGKMHGYMRMYWAKKILEWTKSPEDAMKFAIYLNDKYELDGRDPNGYVGIAWSIGGVHDRAWFDRDIFGKIRYMSYNGAKGKFDIKAYVKKHLQTQLF